MQDEIPVKTVEQVLAEHNFGRATAAKRGRNPRFPWVPIIDFGEQAIGVHRTRTEQLRGRAYEDRDRAVLFAQRMIDARRAGLASKLLDPRYRALRQQNGLPREIS